MIVFADLKVSIVYSSFGRYSEGGQINDVGTTKNADGTYTSVGNGGKIGGKDVLAAKFKVRYEPNDFYRADFTYELGTLMLMVIPN